MDNMLYIIAGLVLILLGAVLVLRKNKAQKSAIRPPANSARNAFTATTKTDYGTPTQSTETNRFDHIMIAQRFMDQQRYDKAMETVNRGLSEKPNDGPLSLKLLSIYATMDQPENFNTLYDRIKMQQDAHTISLADELKASYVGESTAPVATQSMSTVTADTNDSFGGLDFDLPTSKANTTNVIADAPVIESDSAITLNDTTNPLAFSDEFDNTNSTAENVDDSFDLTLSDLENGFDTPAATSETPVAPISTADDNALDTVTNDSSNANEDGDFSDFEFDFDSPIEETTPTTSNSETQDHEASLENEDFVLDFDDLAADTDKDTVVATDAANDIDETSIAHLQNDEDDFALSLDRLDTSDDFETALNSESFVIEADDDMGTVTLEDTPFENNTAAASTTAVDSFADFNFEEQFLNDDVDVSRLDTSNAESNTPLRFDDNTLIDDDGFDTDDSTALSSTADAPVEDDTYADGVKSAADFSSRFAADFDFVKSLDSNQVTLELADQYLKLGEYDSAKRLLNEVITQGNSEQKSKAKMLLGRTA
ncbi:FimV/HubP family polar landmark protein [Psychrobacter sp. NG27]|uniref:FimV/HubP family polar landmark protein n=1 Tax=Psychrobacter sp. NG27 TaxID=2781966 RepID=UPI0018DFB121|nr:FimV/HubP family polar landmark protein [Psychrobacter sp. NG27]MBI0425441.1 pilus assembly protein FimV [Psychrobacter sp. NG27]